VVGSRSKSGASDEGGGGAGGGVNQRVVTTLLNLMDGISCHSCRSSEEELDVAATVSAEGDNEVTSAY